MINERSYRRYVKAVTIGCLLVFLFGLNVAVAENKLPEWIIDTIILPSDNHGYLSYSIFIDDKKNVAILYKETSIYNGRYKAIDLFTQDVFEDKLADQLSHLGKGDYCGWKRLNDDLLSLTYNNPRQIFNTPFRVSEAEERGSARCSTPYSSYVKFYREKIEPAGYYLVFTSKSKVFYFQTGPSCWGMEGKESIWMNSKAVHPRIWPIHENILIIAGSSEPFFILIQASHLSELLKGTKTLVFDKRGIKGFFVKYDLLEKWIKNAEVEKQSKRNRTTLLENIDQYITKQLNR